MTLFGWDASDYDWGRGPMDLVAAKNAGVSFFTYKATESTNVKHVHYGEALNRARAAGIEFLGAYIVPRSGPSVAAQVDYFLNYVNQQTPWWTSTPGFFFQVDTEKWSYDEVSPQRGADVCAELVRRTGRRVVHYAPKWAYGNSIPQPDPLWASSYGDNGIGTLQQKYPGDGSSRWVSYSGRVPVFLQFGSNIVIGSQRTCDGNAFRGSISELRTFITGTVTPEPPIVEEEEIDMFRVASGKKSDKGAIYLVSGVLGAEGKLYAQHIKDDLINKAHGAAGIKLVQLPEEVGLEESGLYTTELPAPSSGGGGGSVVPSYRIESVPGVATPVV